MSILNYFPLPDMRDRQRSILLEIESAIKSGYKNIFLEAPTGFGKCLKPDQLVFTQDGLVRIKNVKQGCSLTRSHALCDSVNMGKKKVITIVTRHGYSLSGAEEHRILTFSQGRYIWKMLKDISCGDYAVIDYSGIEFTSNSVPVNFIQSHEENRKIINLPQYWNEDLAYLMGIYIAEGSLNENTVEIENNGRNIPYINDFMRRLSSAFGINCTWREKKTFRLYSSNLKRFIHSLCPAKDAQSKFIPEIIFRLPKNIVISFLRGLYDGDGYLSEGSIGFVSASKRLCHDLQLLLLALGITATLSEGYKTYNGRKFHTARLEISGGLMIGRFIDTIGIFRKKGIRTSKQIGANLAIPELNQHLEILLKQCRETSGITCRDRQTPTGKALHVMESYAYGLRKPTSRQLKALLETLSTVSFLPEYSELASIANNNFLYSPVKHIVHEDAETELFDFEAQPTHEYVAEGFVNHNSPVAITLARYLGNSHICTATKDLQAQYRRDFPFVFEVKGRGNFPCVVKEDMGLDESCDYGPCVQDEDYDCAFKTRLLDYDVVGQGTAQELVRINPLAEKGYVDNLKKQSKLVELSWRPCHYFHQKWVGAKASHTVYNYRYFLSDIFYTGTTQKRKLLVLDEAHQLESEVGDFRSFTVNRNSLRFLPRFQMPERVVEDVDTWLDFLSNLQDKLLKFIEQAADAVDRGRIAEPYTERNLIDAISREKNLSAVLYDMRASKRNWIVSSIQRDEHNKISRATLTPLETAGYFGEILDKGAIAFFMSATILSKDYLCKVAGIKPDAAKFIQVRDSDFPVKNRPIRLMNVAWLSAKTMQESLPKIVRAVDNIMSMHKNEKGIIHTTSYAQLQFIRDNLGRENAARLIETGSALDREDVIAQHAASKKPTVLISPSLHLGVDLKDDLSRFQVIVKVPYPDLTDRKVSAMKERDPRWYTWYTVLRLAQSYGRCLSEDTQILTRTGWKTKDEVSVGDEVLGLDSQVFEKRNRAIYKKIPRLQWSNVLEFHQFDTDKEMVSIQGKGVDALVTRDHTMIVIPNNHTRNARYHSSIKDVIGSSYGLQKIVAEKLPGRFRLPVAGYLPVTKGYGNKRRIKEWSELMGIVISDGNISKTKRAVTIYQSDVEIKKPTVQRIEELLSTLQLTYRKYVTSKIGEDVFGYKRKSKIITWVINGVDAEKVRDYIFAGRFLVRYRENKNSRRRNILVEYEGKSKIPWWIMTTGRKVERESLLQGLMLGDGSWYGENSGTYFTSNPKLADFVQALLVSLGYRTHLVRRIDRKNEQEIRFTKEAWSEMSNDSVKRGVIYNGKTWCVTTGNGTIVTRRNGSVTITGNSVRSKDDFATTYILDSNIDYLLKSAQDMVPKWFSEAIRV